MNKISAVYQIVNTITNDRYVGSSKDVMRRWAQHKCPSKWKWYPNNPMYKDMQKYGIDKFRFQILAPVMPEHLKQVEQEFIEILNPTYNAVNANGLDVKRRRESHRKTNKKYYNQICCYKGELLPLSALSKRLQRDGVKHYVVEAKKYLRTTKR